VRFGPTAFLGFEESPRAPVQPRLPGHRKRPVTGRSPQRN
jgi:hypothetical protein